MCPVQDDPHHSYQSHVPVAPGRPHSNSTAGEEGFASWRGRRIRKDVGSWPCDTIELEVRLSSFIPFSFVLIEWRVQERADG